MRKSARDRDRDRRKRKERKARKDRSRDRSMDRDSDRDRASDGSGDRGEKRPRAGERSPTADQGPATLESIAASISTLKVSVDAIPTKTKEAVDAGVARANHHTNAEIKKVRTEHEATTQRILQRLDLHERAILRALNAVDGNWVLLATWSEGDTESVRKDKISGVLTKMQVKARQIEHMKKGGNLDQFSRVEFDKLTTCYSFITHWIEAKVSPEGAPNKHIYAHMDETPEARELKRPLRRAEQAVKAYYRSKQEKHEVRVNFRKYPCVLTVDKSSVAKMTGGEVIWSDTELEAAIQPHFKEA